MRLCSDDPDQALKLKWLPFDDEADPVALVQDALELWNAVGAGSLEGDLVRDADDLHGPGVTRYFAVGDGHHVIQTQGLS